MAQAKQEDKLLTFPFGHAARRSAITIAVGEAKHELLTFSFGHAATGGAITIAVGFDDDGYADGIRFMASDEIPDKDVHQMVFAFCQYLLTAVRYEQVKAKIDKMDAFLGKGCDALDEKQLYVIERPDRAKASAQNGKGRYPMAEEKTLRRVTRYSGKDFEVPSPPTPKK